MSKFTKSIENLNKNEKSIKFGREQEMYESPITKITKDLCQSIINREEESIMKVVYDLEINVNKEELVKALKYDRNQYEKGYADGKEMARKILQRFYNSAKSNKNDFADVNSYEIELMAEEFGIELE